MTLTTSSNWAKALYPGVNAWYGKEYGEFPVEWTMLFDDFSSRRRYEEDVGATGLGLAAIKDEGESVSYDSDRQGFTTRYQHVVIGLGINITREAVEDDLYDVIAPRKSQGLAFSMRQTEELICANIYNRAFNSSYKGADNLELLSTAHVNVTGGTWANELAVAADISEASLEQACIDIGNYTNDRGLRIPVMPMSIIIPINLQFDVERILKTQGRVGTANNDLNALKEMGKFPKGAVVNHYLTDADAWFIRTNVKHGMKHWTRRAMEFTQDNDFDTENAKFKATKRFSAGWSDPKALFGSPGA